MDSLLPVPTGANGHDIIADLDPVTVTISQAAADHALAWSLDQRTKSCHEAAHACVSAILSDLRPTVSLPIASVSIKGHGSGRVELGIHDDDQPQHHTASTLRAMMVVTMAGLAGEIELLCEGSDGSQMDIMAASNLADTLLDNGLILAWPPISTSVFNYGGIPQELANLRAKLLTEELTQARQDATRLVHEHRDQILHFASILFRARRLDGEALDVALRAVGLTPPPRGSGARL